MHIIQIPSAAPSFMGIWVIRSPLKIHWYTCMSFETCWSRLIYTKLSSHRSFVINMYVVTMAWRCISPWSFHRSPQRRREMDIFGYINRFPRILSKNNQKKFSLDEENALQSCSEVFTHLWCVRRSVYVWPRSSRKRKMQPHRRSAVCYWGFYKKKVPK